MYWVKKRLVWVVLDRGGRDKDNETGLKEGGGIEMSTTVLPLRNARSICLNTYHVHYKRIRHSSYQDI